MLSRSLFLIVVYMATFASPFNLYGQEISPSHDWMQPDGNGVFRPLNWLRQLKLGTAYFVNPSLPGKVKIIHAYDVHSLIEALEKKVEGENSQEGNEQAEFEDYWIGVQIPQEPAYTFTIPCQKIGQSIQSDDTSKTNAPCVFPRAQLNSSALEQWLKSSDQSQLEGLYVLSPQQYLFSTEGQSVIAWDPHEPVYANEYAVDFNFPTPHLLDPFLLDYPDHHS